jgi:metaxin
LIPGFTTVGYFHSLLIFLLILYVLHWKQLYALHLEPNNFRDLAAPFYCASSTPVVATVLSYRTQAAATEQLLHGRPGGVINPDDIYADVDSAASAIATLLGKDEWFFGAEDAGLFDAAVFSYTHLSLTMSLVAHEERIRKKWFPKVSVSVLGP